MYVDAQTLLWDAAALSTDAASTNTYDTGAAGNDISAGESLCAVLSVDVAADITTGDETYKFQVIQSASSNLGTPTVLVEVPFTAAQVTAGLLAAGKIIIIPIPPGSITQRYLGLYFDGGGTTPTITVTAFIAPQRMIQRDKHYAKGYTIS